ncbi:uncharacterized protein LOC135436858 [Drosophila montana]|uniref:uncharacterized protein LOC135436858 n=1 Tax=Drosophila montana TaxID=40370 RepID=UPI00313D0B07
MRSTHLAIILFTLKLGLVVGSLKFQSLECIVHIPRVVIVEECRIRAFNRTQNSLNLKVHLKETISKMQVNFKFLKRERGGWHPFLYSMTLDLCKFFQSPNRHPLPAIIFYYVKDYTNVNHSCPFLANTYMELGAFQLDELSIMKRFPVEAGQYALHTSWYSKNQLIFQVNGSVNYIK